MATTTTTTTTKKESAQLIDLYEDEAVATGESNKPLTRVPNKYAPQAGIHLYEFPASFYSCEARLVLEEKGLEYEEHDICIVGGVFDQYEPDYVRINPRCVVPTLVVDGQVTSDAHNIVLNADEIFPNTTPLYPKTDETQRALIKEQFDLACSVFVEALTYGEVEGGPKLPWIMRPMMKKNHGRKFKALTSKLEEHKNDPYLKRCYEGKLKILTKQIEVLGDEENLLEVLDATKLIFEKLNQQLAKGPAAASSDAWLCGPNYTIADMQWGLNLVRLKMRGYEDLFWGQYPAVAQYCNRLEERPSIQKAVVAYQEKSVVIKLIFQRKLQRNQKKILVGGIVLAAAIAAWFMNASSNGGGQGKTERWGL